MRVGSVLGAHVARVALGKDPGLLPSTHVDAHNNPNSIPPGSDASSDFHKHAGRILMHRKKFRNQNKILEKESGVLTLSSKPQSERASGQLLCSACLGASECRGRLTTPPP